MFRRLVWTTAAVVIAVGAAVLAWRARARPVAEPSPAVASAPVTDDAPDVTDLAPAADITAADITPDITPHVDRPSEAVTAPRVYAATDAAVDAPAEPTLDLEQIASDLEGVAAALARLDDGTYWTDEVTGEPLVEELLVADPVARRNR